MVTKEEYESIKKIVDNIKNGVHDDEPMEIDRISDDDNIQKFYEKWYIGDLTDQEWIQLRDEVVAYIKEKKDVDEEALSEFMESLVTICADIEGEDD